MDQPSSELSLLVIAAAAVVAPLVAELLRRFRVPTVLFELLLGILIGPHVLGWAIETEFVSDLSLLGLAFLMLLAGYEVDLKEMRGSVLNRAGVGWAFSLAVGLGVGGLLAISDFAVSELLIGLCLTTTALGVLLPMLHDRGLLSSPIGRFALGAGTVGEFGPIVAVAVLLSGDAPLREALLLLGFVVVAVTAGLFAARPQPPAFVEMLQRHLHTSSQLPVRITILLLTLMVFFASELGLDMILGAFTAGVLLRLLRSPSQAPELDPRLESIGFGFLIPIFFIVSGMSFDISTFTSDPASLLRVPIFLALFLVVRGLPALLVYRGLLPGRARLGLGVLQATALPLVVVITQIGLDTGRMLPDNAAALVGAAMLSVLVFPLIGFAFIGEPPSSEPGDDRAMTADEL